MNITVPASCTGLNRTPWKRNVIRKADGKAQKATGSYEFSLGERYYYPYWIAKIYTEKERLLFGSKVLYFYVVCDAMNGGYLVLRNLPSLREEDVEEVRLLSALIPHSRFETEIVKESIYDRIERQFIFGKPYSACKEIRTVYIPMQEVFVRQKDSRQPFKRFYSNLCTGEAKSSMGEKKGAVRNDYGEEGNYADPSAQGANPAGRRSS